jgi:hypothetical protein
MPERYSINRLRSLTEAAVDASSIIYMLKAGFLGLLGHTIRLVTIEAVRDETGWRPPEVEVRREPALDPGLPGPGALSNDERLLRFAADSGLPVISEDRGLLEEAGRRGLDYYNSLMMLLLLRHRGRIDDAWYVEARDRLLSVGRYSDEIVRRYEGFARELGL